MHFRNMITFFDLQDMFRSNIDHLQLESESYNKFKTICLLGCKNDNYFIREPTTVRVYAVFVVLSFCSLSISKFHATSLF